VYRWASASAVAGATALAADDEGSLEGEAAADRGSVAVPLGEGGSGNRVGTDGAFIVVAGTVDGGGGEGGGGCDTGGTSGTSICAGRRFFCGKRVGGCGGRESEEGVEVAFFTAGIIGTRRDGLNRFCDGVRLTRSDAFGSLRAAKCAVGARILPLKPSPRGVATRGGGASILPLLRPPLPLVSDI
jgi:hypothetical protein